MITPQIPGTCHCQCHWPDSGIKHSVPCCRGQCSICDAYYTDEEHVEACQARLDELEEKSADT